MNRGDAHSGRKIHNGKRTRRYRSIMGWLAEFVMTRPNIVAHAEQWSEASV
jgi:hypothetical protein